MVKNKVFFMVVVAAIGSMVVGCSSSYIIGYVHYS